MNPMPPPAGIPRITGPVGAPNGIAVPRTPTALGARRMPPVNRSQRTEWIGVPTAYAPPMRQSSADWPIIETYVHAPAVDPDEEAPHPITDSRESSGESPRTPQR